MVHEKQMKLEGDRKKKKGKMSVNEVRREETVLWMEEKSWVNGQVNTRPDSASDSAPPSESHVIFRIQPMKVILLLLGFWLK